MTIYRKKRKKSRAQKLCRRREEFVRQLKQSNKDITAAEIEKELKKYEMVENDLYEDDIKYNARMRQVRADIVAKYGTDKESLHKIRADIIHNLVNEKRSFFGMEPIGHLNPLAESEKKRILAMKENLADINNVIDAAAAELPEKHDRSQQENVILGTSNNQKLVDSYQAEMELKYQDDKLILAERKKRINRELGQSSAQIKKEIQLDRKVLTKKEFWRQEMLKSKKYKNDADLVRRDLDKKVAKYRKKQEEYLHMGIDPYEEDEKTAKMANCIWAEINKIRLDGGWRDMSAAQKMKYFSQKYPDFHANYQIVLKYMIFELKYNVLAFSRFLTRNRENIPKEGAKYDEIQDVRLANQAKYAQYLYEETQKKNRQHIDAVKARNIYTFALDTLKREKKKFIKNYDAAKKKIDAEKIGKIKTSMADLLSTVRAGKKINEEDSEIIKLFSNYINI